MCKSDPVRFATFNLLHGIPLRDRAPAAEHAAHGTHRPGDAAHASAAPPGRTAPTGRSEDVGDTHLTAAGASPIERARWSPEATDDGDLQRTIEEFVALGPIDVLALQEVDRNQPRSAQADQARMFAEALGATAWRFVPSVRGTPGIAAEGAAWVPATEADDLLEANAAQAAAQAGGARGGGQATAKGGARTSSRSGSQAASRAGSRGGARSAIEAGPRYGIALISRWPVREWRIKRFPPVPLSLPLMAPSAGPPKTVRVPDEPRSAVAAVIETPYADVTVATAHLTFVPGYNTRQLSEMRAFLAGLPRPMVLLGDFNTPGGIPSLVTGWHQVARVPTYPIARPRVQFDHILADGWDPEALEAAHHSAHAVPMPVSDHLALMADFPLP